MGIKGHFDMDDILKRELQAIEDNVIGILQRVGEEFVTDARSALKIDTTAFPSQRIDPKTKRAYSPGEYVDQTANLRSSIGYFILNNGEVVAETLSGTAEGVLAAKEPLLNNSGRGYSIMGVAGMEYASYLESMGYNVISSQNLNLIVDLTNLLKKYTATLGKKGQSVSFDTAFTGPSSTLL